MTNSCCCCCLFALMRRVFEVFFVMTTTCTRGAIHFRLVWCRFRNSRHFAEIPSIVCLFFCRSGIRNVGGVSVPTHLHVSHRSCLLTCLLHSMFFVLFERNFDDICRHRKKRSEKSKLRGSLGSDRLDAHRRDKNRDTRRNCRKKSSLATSAENFAFKVAMLGKSAEKCDRLATM